MKEREEALVMERNRAHAEMAAMVAEMVRHPTLDTCDTVIG
jgi:hypothetical protein